METVLSVACNCSIVARRAENGVETRPVAQDTLRSRRLSAGVPKARLERGWRVGRLRCILALDGIYVLGG